MKAAFVVTSPQDIPEKLRQHYIVVTKDNFREIYYQYAQMSGALVLFIHSELNSELMLKFVEDYKGSLAMFFGGTVSPVLLSRFNYATNKRPFRRLPFPKRSFEEETVEGIKKYL